MTMTHEKLSLMVAWSSSVSISCFRVQSSFGHLVWLSNNFLEGTWGVFILWKHVLREAVPHTFFRKTSAILNPLKPLETPWNPFKSLETHLKPLEILLDICMGQSIWKYFWTLAYNCQFENISGHPRAADNLKILLDTPVRQSIWKYSWIPACNSQ